MPKSSCILCKKTWTQEGFKMFHVPGNELKMKYWSESCGVSLNKTSKICSLHFSAADYVPDSKRMKLASEALPMTVDFVEDSPISIDIGTQTDMNNQTELSDEVACLRARVEELEKLERAFSSIFTKGQVWKLCNPEKQIRWDWEDISSAIALHASGRRAYSHLYQKGFPLPGESTIRKWLKKVPVQEGILSFSLGILQNANQLPPADRLCIFSFDEMKIDEQYEYDVPEDRVRQPCNQVQLGIVRGLQSSWKQPIFCQYDCKITKEILEDIIKKIEEVGYTIVGIVSDMGSRNTSLWKELKITTEQCWFTNPANGGKVFVFADAPHSLKLARNHYLTTGYDIFGKLLTPRTMAQLLTLTSGSDASIAYKLTEEHLTAHHAARQKVKLAAQMFSRSVASAIRRCHQLGHDLYCPIETAEFVSIVNDWFNVFNSKLSTFQLYPTKQPFGKSLAEQLHTLAKMDECMLNMRAHGRNSLLPFQRGVLMSNNSLRGLYEYVRERYGLEYIVTYRLNQDIVEHFFGAMRAKGGLFDNPSAMGFKYRLRKYLLARGTEYLAGRGNVESDETEWIRISDTSVENLSLIISDEEMISKEFDLSNELAFPEEMLQDAHIDQLHEEALEYIAGFVIRKLGLTEYVSNGETCTYTDVVSMGALITPSIEFMAEIKRLEAIFNAFNGDKINTCSNYMQQLIACAQHVNISIEVKKLFFKSRMYQRIKYLNKQIKNNRKRH